MSIPPRLVRELRRFARDEEIALWESVHDDYHQETRWSPASAYLDGYLAWSSRRGGRPTPPGYRTWIINGERMAEERYRAEQRTQEERAPQPPRTDEERALAAWRKRFVD